MMSILTKIKLQYKNIEYKDNNAQDKAENTEGKYDTVNRPNFEHRDMPCLEQSVFFVT